MKFQVLHPGLKLQYFLHRKWKDAWIKTAEQLVRDEFDNYRSPVEISGPDSATSEDFTDFADFALENMVIKVRDELEEYLALPVEKVKDPLKWWWDHRKAYPALSRMALDYLSCPGMLFPLLSNTLFIDHNLATSTAVERVFSQGRHLLHFSRNRLMPKSIRALLCLGSWSNNELLDMPSLVAAITPSKKRKFSESEGLEDVEAGDVNQ